MQPSLDKSVPGNYRPISNLNFISKVLERLFLTRYSHEFLNLQISTSTSVHIDAFFPQKRLFYPQLTTFFTLPTVVSLPFSYL